MGIFRGQGRDDTLALCHAAWDAGVVLVEIPLMGEDDLVVLEAAVSEGASRGRFVGAGTIISADQVEAVRRRGGAFTVAPGFDSEVAGASVAAGLPHLPGVATGGEVQAAFSAGFRWQKAFPASVLGSEWVRAMRAPFPEVSFVATGGISARNASEFLNAGCRGLAVGSAFESTESAAELAAAIA